MNVKSAGSRRRFLLGAGTASVGAVATLAVATKSGLPEPKAAAVKDGRGYQLTEHVRNYYRTTAI
ncbi:MAG: formate dehydrogenase [Burkholderiales bacterium]